MIKQLLVILSICLSLQAGFGREVTKVYLFPEPVIERSGDYEIVWLDGCRLLGETGRATLPFHPVELLLPPGEVAVSIDFIFEDETILPGQHFLLPRQSPRPISEGPFDEWIIDKTFYTTSSSYPSGEPEGVSTHFMNGYGIALSAFTPLRYIPSSGQVSYYRKVTVKINTAADPEAGERSLLYHPSGRNTGKVQSIVQNPELIKFYPLSSSGRTDDYEYLILTRNQYLPEFDTLISFYKFRGIRARAVAVEYIDTLMTGLDRQERLRNYIIDEYQDHNIGYVLIGGDTNIVTYRGFYCTVFSGGSYMTDYGIPSDLYYSALDGSWNTDGDGNWGEPDEDDLYPEVAVGRLTFSDTAELHNMLHKTFSYQANPVLGELTHPLLAGEHLWSSPETWGSDYMRLLVGLKSNNGYTTQGIPPTQPIDSLYDEYGTWTKTDMMNKINSGKPWVHHCGHANYTTVMKMYNGDITNANFSGANGTVHNYTIVYTHGCNCGGYDKSDCIAERMVGIDNFAVAFLGNSRYGWFVEGTTDGPSEHLHREFMDALYRDSLYRAGDALLKSKAETAPFVEVSGEYEPGATRWCFYDNYLLGDPLLAMWTEEPHAVYTNYTPLIPAGADSVVIQLSGPGNRYEGFTCSLIQNDTLFGAAYSDSTGTAVICPEDFLNYGDATLIISGYNILPHSYPIEVGDCWLGNSTDWNDYHNWQSGIVPGINSCVIIPADPVGGNFPTTNSGASRQCKTMLLEPGVNFQLKSGEIFTILGSQ